MNEEKGNLDKDTELAKFEEDLTEHIKKKAGIEKLKKELSTFAEDAAEKLPEDKTAGPENALSREIAAAEEENRKKLIETCSAIAKKEIPSKDVVATIGRVKDFAQKTGVTLVAEEDPEALIKREKIEQLRMLAKEIKIKAEEENVEILVNELKVLAEQNEIDLDEETDIIELNKYQRKGYVSEAIKLLKKVQGMSEIK